MNEKIQKLIDEICELTAIEVGELTEGLQNKLGITLNQPVIQAQVQSEEVPKEKLAFDVWLKKAGEQKINIIKLIRELTGKSLMESKAFVESAPQLIKGALTKVEADNLVSRLSEAGAMAELK